MNEQSFGFVNCNFIRRIIFCLFIIEEASTAIFYYNTIWQFVLPVACTTGYILKSTPFACY